MNKNWAKVASISTYTAILKSRGDSMFASGLESDITTGLDDALHDIFFKEISDLLSEEYFFLNINGIFEIFALLDFVSGLDSELVKHLIVSYKGAHHGFE